MMKCNPRVSNGKHANSELNSLYIFSKENTLMNSEKMAEFREKIF